MVTTQVQLDSSQYERLKQQADAENKTVADKLREAVDVYLSQEET